MGEKEGGRRKEKKQQVKLLTSRYQSVPLDPFIYSD